ncbi:MAG: hypothetical protein DRN30_00900 [Thermoplasmata archaeon]|nr:MAG: hypothetical protein DRN30_00900 [Thermoplasmata archaeon]
MATANESGYGAFLPKHQNETVQREALRGQMVKEASYLTEMDKVYAELDEMARQYDESLASKESQFARKLDFEYDSLEQQAEQFDQSLELNWYGAETQRISARSQAIHQSGLLDLAEDQFEFQQSEAEAQREFGESQLDLVSEIYDQMGSSQMAGIDQPGTQLQDQTESERIPSGSGQIFSTGSNSYSGNVSIYDYNPLSDQFEPA